MKNTVKLYEPQLREIIAESVKKVLSEGPNKDAFIMQQIHQAIQSYDEWSQKLYEVKEQSWKEHGGKSTPELEHCFWAYRILETMNNLLNSYYLSLEQQNSQGNQPQL